MKLKTVIAIFITAILLSSCATQENSVNTRQTDGSDKVPVSQIWEGYEELQGKNYGDVLVLPDKIIPSNIAELYTLPVDLSSDGDHSAQSKEYFKRFFGDGFDENAISFNEDEDTYIYATANGDFSAFGLGRPFTAIKGGESPAAGEIIAYYNPWTDLDTVLELANGSCTVKEVTDTVNSFLKDSYEPLFSDLDLKIESVMLYERAGDLKRIVRCKVSASYRGLMLEDDLSPLFEVENKPFYKIITNYTPAKIEFELDSKDNIINAITTLLFANSEKSAKLEELISLSQAAELLEKELALFSHYSISEIKLMYCCKVRLPSLAPPDMGPGQSVNDFPELEAEMYEEFGDIPPRTFVPTWCFYLQNQNGNRDSLKVNAVTGEITVDINRG